MVLSPAQYKLAEEKSLNDNPPKNLVELFELRETTSRFIIQCLADRQIQYILKERSSDACIYNNQMVHNPVGSHAVKFKPISNNYLYYY